MRPTEPGWYWEDADATPIMRRVLRDRVCLYVDRSGYGDELSEFQGTFLGPLVPPERPER